MRRIVIAMLILCLSLNAWAETVNVRIDGQNLLNSRTAFNDYQKNAQLTSRMLFITPGSTPELKFGTGADYRVSSDGRVYDKAGQYVGQKLAPEGITTIANAGLPAVASSISFPYTVEAGRGITTLADTRQTAPTTPSISRDISGTYIDRLGGMATGADDKVTFGGLTYHAQIFGDKKAFMTAPDAAGNRNVLYIEDNGDLKEYRMNKDDQVTTAWSVQNGVNTVIPAQPGALPIGIHDALLGNYGAPAAPAGATTPAAPAAPALPVAQAGTAAFDAAVTSAGAKPGTEITVGATTFTKQGDVYVADVSAAGRNELRVVDGKLYEFHVDNQGKTTSGWSIQGGQRNQLFGDDLARVAPPAATGAANAPPGFTPIQQGPTAPQPTGPPTGALSQISGNTLTKDEQTLITSTQNKADVVVYVGTDGKVHAATTAQVNVDANGAVTPKPPNLPVPGQPAAPPLPQGGTRLPSFVANDLIANPSSRISTVSTNGAPPQYVLQTAIEDKGVFVDYRRTTTTTYELPPGADGKNPAAYTTHVQTVNEKDDILTAGYSVTKTESTFAHRVKLADGTYFDDQRGAELTFGGRTAQVVTQYVTVADRRTELESSKTGKSAAEITNINGEITKLSGLDANAPLARSNVGVVVGGTTIGAMTPPGSFRPTAEMESALRADLASKGKNPQEIQDAIQNGDYEQYIALQLRKNGASAADANDQAAEVAVNVRYARRQVNGYDWWEDHHARLPGETTFDQFTRVAGQYLRTYDKFAGLGRVSTLFMGDYVQKNREALAKSFCGFAGLQTCLVSAICGEIHEISSSNVLVGTDTTGHKINSASLNAERSEAVLLQGLTTQELVDILGNTSTINGRFVDLTDPDFKPASLGELKLRLYHVEYSISNRLPEEQVSYNVEFRRLNAPVLIAATAQPNRSATLDEYEGNYSQYLRRPRGVNNQGTSATVSWFPERKQLQTGKTDHNHLQKYSTNEYDAACLVFNPALPSGKSSSSTVKELCVPFTEYSGGATQIEAVGNVTGPGPSGTGPTTTPTPGTPPPRTTTPGAAI